MFLPSFSAHVYFIHFLSLQWNVTVLNVIALKLLFGVPETIKYRSPKDWQMQMYSLSSSKRFLFTIMKKKPEYNHSHLESTFYTAEGHEVQETIWAWLEQKVEKHPPKAAICHRANQYRTTTHTHKHWENIHTAHNADLSQKSNWDCVCVTTEPVSHLQTLLYTACEKLIRALYEYKGGSTAEQN